MNTCEQMQDLFIEALYNDLDAERSKTLEAHFSSCPDCAAEYSTMRSTLKIMDSRARPDMNDAYWQSFDARLQERMTSARQPKPAIPFTRRVPVWAWQAAAAIILVVLGVLIGRTYLKEESPQIAHPTEQRLPIQRVNANPEVQRFLEKSEVLIIGVVNTDASNEEGYSTGLAHQKKVSQDLIREASVIKTKLNDPRQRRLRELVSDLEVVLLQIANLEAEQDQPEIEILKSGVDRKGLLLKINVEQMRLSNPKAEVPGSEKKPKGPAI